MFARISETAALRIAWLRDAAKPARVFGKALRWLLWLVVLGHAALCVLILLASVALLRVNPPVTALMAYRRLTTHEASRPIRYVPLRQIPPVFRAMVVRLEDMHFYQHPGVDLGALRDALSINAAIGRTAVGGSTIPMQLARNFFLTPRKTYFRKYLESIIALEMDLILPKSRILELYLNSIEWGKGVFGVGAASSASYGTSVASLSLDQMRRLAAIITNPLRYTVETFSLSPQMAERYNYLVSRFPDPEAAPAEQGAVAPIPDEPNGSVPSLAPPPPVARPMEQPSP
jgi:monofunctional biosynthetic peptidoglycan transglycosylase